jgi:hypothetical protein
MLTPLPFPFSRNRFRHDLLARDDMVCLVARTNELTDSVHWEVVVLQPAYPFRSPPGSPPDHEAYPTSEDWGTHGWTYTSRLDAEQKYRSLASGAAVEPR